MASTREHEVEGVTTFAVTPLTSYRYVLKLKNDKLSIWMEDQTSKKQWYKSEMAKDEYVTPDNCISNASAMDYLKCFQDSLNSEQYESKDVQRRLEMLEGGAVRLGLDFQFHIFRLARVTKFEFVLNPVVSGKQIDVLESKVRDLQDVVERHRGELKRLREGVGTRVKLTASTKDAATSNLLWNDIESEAFDVNCETGEVIIQRSGVYDITTMVNGKNTSQFHVELLKNGRGILSDRVGFFGGATDSILSTTTWLEADDCLEVKSTSRKQQAFLVLVPIGCF